MAGSTLSGFLIVEDTEALDLMSNVVVAEQLTNECAWCNSEAGTDQGNGSHGICERHVEEVYAAYQAKKAAA